MKEEEQQQQKFLVSVSPHIRADENITSIMWTVVAALVPALVASFLFFSARSLLVVGISVGCAVLTEYVIQKIRRVDVTVSDGSAVLAGLLLAFTLPPNVPWYLPAIGGVFAIAIAKQAFGGLGMNVWNPALASRAFLLASFPTSMVMSKWPVVRELASGTVTGVDAYTEATPLLALKEGLEMKATGWEMFLGWIPGSLGETSALALLAGGLFLIIKKIVDWRLPASYIGTVVLLTFVFPHKTGDGFSAFFSGDPVVHLFAGGLFLGAFFMATDMVTSPLTVRGQIVFGVGCGVLTAVIRLYGGYPEGVCYSILLMNTFVPLIDRYTRPRKLGG